MMDKLIVTNSHFQRLMLPWHPLLSRLYLAELFIQILRCMKYARLGSRQTRLFVHRLLSDFPPESLPVPGHLIPILQSIAVGESDDPSYGLISPTIRDDFGHLPPSILWEIHSMDYVHPNIPLIASSLNAIHEDPNILDYSDPSTFDDSEDRTMMGHVFHAQDWTHRTCCPNLVRHERIRVFHSRY